MTLTLSQRKRLAIIEAAIVEFRLNGFQTSSMDAVAARAEVSKRTVYNHFPSKDALFKELVRQLVEAGQRATEYQFDPAKTLKTQLQEFAHQELELLCDSRFLDLSRITMAEAMLSPERAKSVLKDVSETESYFERWINDAINAGAIKQADPVMASRQFLGLIKSLAFWPQLLTGHPAPDPKHAKQIAADAAMMFLSRYEI
jgi:TetR/AcrR family transcriptional regulator of autoinduction and epiphytic fitness